MPFPSLGCLPHPGIKPGSPALQAYSLPSEPPGEPIVILISWLSAVLSRWLRGKESACNTGDPGLIPGWGRHPREGNGNPTPVFLPGKSQGRRNLAVYGPRGRTESNTTEHPHCTSCLQMPHFVGCGFQAGSPVCPRAPQPLQVRLAGMRALLSHLPPVLEYQRAQGTHGLGVDVYGPRPPRQLQSS